MEAFLFLLGGVAATYFSLRVVIPFLIGIIGERHFASCSSFDGCSVLIAGGLLTAGLLMTWGNSPYSRWSWLTPALVALVVALFGLAYLRWLGALDGADKKGEWQIVEGHILGSAGQELHPTCLRENSYYNQTGPFSGYSVYSLTLADHERWLGTNAYNSKSDFQRDKEALQQLPNIKWFDLIWLWRAEEKKWLTVYLPGEWTPFLCGPLDRLLEEDRTWWQQWLFPEFAKHIGKEVDASDALQRFERFKEAYGDGAPDEGFIRFEKRLRTLLNSPGPVIALDLSSYDQLQRQVAGPNVVISFETGSDFIILKSGV